LDPRGLTIRRDPTFPRKMKPARAVLPLFVLSLGAAAVPLALGCSGSGGSTGGGNPVHYVLAPSAHVVQTAPTTVTDTTITFPSTGEIAALAIGDVVVSPTAVYPPYARKITGIGQGPEGTVLQTAPARLTDVYDDLQINLDMDLAGSTNLAPQTASPGALRLETVTWGGVSTKTYGLPADVGTLDLGAKVGSIDLSGSSLGLNQGAWHLVHILDLKNLASAPQKLEFTGAVTPVLAAKFKILAKASAKSREVEWLPSGTPVVAVPIAPGYAVGVFLKATATASVTIDAALDVSLHAAIPTTIDEGIACDSGCILPTSWYGIDRSSYQITGASAQISPSANVALGIEVSPVKMTWNLGAMGVDQDFLKTKGVLGIEMEPAVGMEGAYDFQHQDRSRVSAYAKVGGSLAGQLEFFGRDLGTRSIPIVEWKDVFWCFNHDVSFCQGDDGGAQGGSCAVDGGLNPDNDCRICQPSAGGSSLQWSDAPDGVSCATGHCFAGACLDGCYVDGTPQPIGAQDPLQDCRMCRPWASLLSWSPADDGTACGDGSQVCLAGECVTPDGGLPDGGPAGASACAGNPDCRAGQVCHGGACIAGCFVQGTYYGDAAPNPSNLCEQCQPSVSTSSWSPGADLAACDSHGGFCVAGVCVPARDAGLDAGGRSAVGAGDASADVTIDSTPICVEGTPCGSGRVCHDGSCVAGCSIGSSFYSQGSASPANLCQTCQPATSTVAWSSVPSPSVPTFSRAWSGGWSPGYECGWGYSHVTGTAQGSLSGDHVSSFSFTGSDPGGLSVTCTAQALQAAAGNCEATGTMSCTANGSHSSGTVQVYLVGCGSGQTWEFAYSATTSDNPGCLPSTNPTETCP
jgi:hypothetical protein